MTAYYKHSILEELEVNIKLTCDDVKKLILKATECESDFDVGSLELTEQMSPDGVEMVLLRGRARKLVSIVQEKGNAATVTEVVSSAQETDLSTALSASGLAWQKCDITVDGHFTARGAAVFDDGRLSHSTLAQKLDALSRNNVDIVPLIDIGNRAIQQVRLVRNIYGTSLRNAKYAILGGDKPDDADEPHRIVPSGGRKIMLLDSAGCPIGSSSYSVAFPPMRDERAFMAFLGNAVAERDLVGEIRFVIVGK